MKRKNMTRNALITSIISLLLCASMLVGTTFAWFTDSVTSDRNTIAAGNLDIKLEYSVLENGQWTTYEEVDSATDIYSYDNWEPGYVSIAKFKVTNVGSLALKYRLSTDVYEETPGVNVNGETFYLSNYLYSEVVAVDATREDILASTTGKRLKAPVNGVPNTDLIINAQSLEPNDYKEVAMAIWMPTTVGNEANHNGTQPSISFGINLLATQFTSEDDSFNDQYDVNATDPIVAWASAPVDASLANYAMDMLKSNGGKIGAIDVPQAAVDPAADNVSVFVKETNTYANITVADEEDSRTFDVKVEGLKPNNDVEVTVELNIGTGRTGVKLYHYDQEHPSSYNPGTGILTFRSTEFSPYTVVYDTVAVEEDVDSLDKEVPVATITNADECENVSLNWTGWGGYNPSAGIAQQLNSVYLFTSPDDSESVQESFYKDWYCDYYVKFVPAENVEMTKLPAGSITLGGNYGGYGWVGFDNPEVDVNTFIPLLGSVLGSCDEEGTMVDTGWTYQSVVDLVQKFWCGVGEANGCQIELDGAKFVVELRLTNPENFDDYIAVNTVTYTFGGDSVIENYQG